MVLYQLPELTDLHIVSTDKKTALTFLKIFLFESDMMVL